MTIGTPTPLSRFSGPAVLQSHEVTGDHRRNKAERPRIVTDDPKPDLHDSPLLGAPMRGPPPGPVHTPLETIAMQAKAAAAGAGSAVESPDMSQVLSMLTAILARLDSLEARVTILDGAEGAL
jgi:hypothetical protein